MDVDFSKLPIEICRQIPISLRSYGNIHVLEELPVTIQYIIKKYFEKNLNISYDISFDIKPIISKYSDFKSIDNMTDLVVEYLKNYLLVVPETYPFDPYFGSKLKYQVQTRDVSLQQTLVSTEVNNIVAAISVDTGADVDVESIEVTPISMGTNTEYTATVFLKINGEQRKKINVDFYGAS